MPARNREFRSDNFSWLRAQRKSTHNGSSRHRSAQVGARAVVRVHQNRERWKTIQFPHLLAELTFGGDKRLLSHQSTSLFTHFEAAASGDAISKKYSNSAKARSIVSHKDVVNASPVLSRKISKD
jgi:hypothetical protein